MGCYFGIFWGRSFLEFSWDKLRCSLYFRVAVTQKVVLPNSRADPFAITRVASVQPARFTGLCLQIAKTSTLQFEVWTRFKTPHVRRRFVHEKGTCWAHGTKLWVSGMFRGKVDVRDRLGSSCYQFFSCKTTLCTGSSRRSETTCLDHSLGVTTTALFITGVSIPGNFVPLPLHSSVGSPFSPGGCPASVVSHG